MKKERKYDVKRISSLLVVALVVVLLPVSALAQSGFVRYENEGLGFSVNYPGDWEYYEGLMGTSFIALSPMESANDAFRENFNVTIEDLGGYSISLDDYYTLGINQLAGAITDFKLIGGGDTVLAGRLAKLVVFTGTQGELELKWLQGYVLVDDLAYVITFVAESDRFDSYMPDVYTAFNTFSVW